jgi:hypothetical protein
MKITRLGVLIVFWFLYFGINAVWSGYFLANGPTIADPAVGRIYEFVQKGGTPRYATFEEWLYIQSPWMVAPVVVLIGLFLRGREKANKEGNARSE